ILPVEPGRRIIDRDNFNGVDAKHRRRRHRPTQRIDQQELSELLPLGGLIDGKPPQMSNWHWIPWKSLSGVLRKALKLDCPGGKRVIACYDTLAGPYGDERAADPQSLILVCESLEELIQRRLATGKRLPLVCRRQRLDRPVS